MRILFGPILTFVIASWLINEGGRCPNFGFGVRMGRVPTPFDGAPEIRQLMGWRLMGLGRIRRGIRRGLEKGSASVALVAIPAAGPVRSDASPGVLSDLLHPRT